MPPHTLSVPSEVKYKDTNSPNKINQASPPALYNLIDIPKDCFSARWRLLKLQDYLNNKQFKKAYKFLDKIKNTPENKNTCLYFPREVIKYILEVIRVRWILRKIIFIF